MNPFDFNSPNGEEELKKWLGERIPQFVTLTDQIWKMLSDESKLTEAEKSKKITEIAAAFVKSGGSCYASTNLSNDQLQMFEKLMPGLISMASISVKGPLLPIQNQDIAKYSKSEAAKLLGISVSSLERKMSLHEIEYTKHGNEKSAKVTFTQVALDTFRQKNTRPVKEKRKKAF